MAERSPRNMTDYEAEYAAFRWDRPERFNFAIDVVDRWASERPDAPAMLHCDDRGNRKVYSWRELAERSVHAALFLRDLGLRPGDGVFTMLPRLAEWWILALGCMRSNLVLMPGTTMLTGKDVRYRLELGRARAVVTTAEHLSKFEVGAHADVIAWVCTDEASTPWVRFRTQTVDGARAAEFPDTAADDRMLVYFTSGTTGMPKMVPQTHASYGIGHGVTGKYWLDLGPDDVHFTLSDTGWAKCAWGKVFGPWSQGACSVVYDFRGRFEGKAILDLLAREKVSTFCAPPTAWRAIVLEDLQKWSFPALRHVISAGEPLNPEVIEAWKRATGLTIREGYGQTETVAIVGMFQCLPFKPGSMGRPSPGFDVRIIDQAGREVSAGQEGDIAVRVKPERPVGMFAGYLGDETTNAAALRGDFYVTGDRAVRDEDGYLWFVGRADDVIKTSGYRVGPFEVESALLEHPAVAESAVVGVPDEKLGQRIKAFVVLKPSVAGSEALARELQDHVKRTTAPYKYPREISFVTELPKTVSGKIRRVELRQDR
ncbi:MAG TPA: AMP-binding protein [Myxococcaceae bacterium]|nr:AMP-binding protein [Myxococcaceae bacterium]